jgi:spore coat polysaccharide biosynthesis predicted glycosyltransferase SpsG
LAETGLQIRVAVGHANTQRAQIQKLADQFGHVTLIEQQDYVSSLASAHVAVLAAGSSLWEACAVGTPSIGLVVADNQVDLAHAAEKMAICQIIDARNIPRPSLLLWIIKNVNRGLMDRVSFQMISPNSTKNLALQICKLVRI